MPAATLHKRYRSNLVWLIGLDTCLILVVIGLTGGIVESHVGFVLLVVPAVVAFVRGASQTLLVTSIVIGIVIIWETHWIHEPSFLQPPSEWFAWCFKEFFKMFHVKLLSAKASQNHLAAVAYGFGMCVGIILTLVQDFFTVKRSLPDRLKNESTSMSFL